MPFPSGGQLLLNGYGMRPGSAVLRTEMETGPPKQAKIKSQVMVGRPVQYLYTETELQAFETWFRGTECNWGASWFDWTDPRDGVAKQMRIVDGLYDVTPHNETEGAPLKWIVSLNLENWES